MIIARADGAIRILKVGGVDAEGITAEVMSGAARCICAVRVEQTSAATM